MTSMPSFSWAYALPIAGPALAFLYQVIVLVMLAVWHECEWTAMTNHIALRLAVLGASVASSFALQAAESSVRPEVVVQTSLAFFIIAFKLIQHTRLYDVEGGPAPDLDVNCVKGKVVLVTGANAGIGKETVRQLVGLGATVVLACRSESRAKDAMQDVLSSIPDEKSRAMAKSRLYFIPLDLSDFSSVRRAVHLFSELKLPLHVLINNAGVMMGTKHLTKDGLELTMQANHLGHFLLTVMLLPKLLESPGARVVTVTSSTYALAKNGLDFDDMFCDSIRTYSLFGQYAQSKLANIYFCKELAKRYPQLNSTAVHPGLVRTDVVRNMPWYLKYPNIWFAYIVASLQKKPSQGAHTSVYCAAATPPPPSGSYLVNSQVTETKACANNDKDAEKLWEVSEKLVGLSNNDQGNRQ